MNMDVILTIIASLTLIYIFFSLVELIFGFSTIKNLSTQTILPDSKLPSVSIIFSALNEEKDIEAVVTSLLSLEYPDFEVIAINDRSDDNTAAILNALKVKYAQLQVHHLSALPPDWLGKNHALYHGARFAKGEWLLFTDADVLMRKDTLTRAVSYAKERQLHHLTLCELHVKTTFWLRILLLAYYLIYGVVLKPWRIRHDWSNKSLGHGAFNLVQREVYETCGTHQAIALECLDDLKLGALIKDRGYRQDIADGRDLVKRQWYATLPGMIEGWKKNTFAFFNYQLIVFLAAAIFAVVFFLMPVVSVFFTKGTLLLLNGLNVGCMLLAGACICRHFRLPMYYAVFYPVSILLLLYAILNSIVVTYRQGGIVWRGTHYPLSLLRRKAG